MGQLFEKAKTNEMKTAEEFLKEFSGFGFSNGIPLYTKDGRAYKITDIMEQYAKEQKRQEAIEFVRHYKRTESKAEFWHRERYEEFYDQWKSKQDT